MKMSELPKKTEELELSEELQEPKRRSDCGPGARHARRRSARIPTGTACGDTPERFERALRYLTSGYRQDPEKVLNGAMFDVCYDQMVVVKDIDFFSLCEHHILPFFGKCHVAYLPNKRVVGLSKIPRLVNMFARRLQIQERLTNQIAQAIQKCIQPIGVGVVIEARHLCMVMRGVEKHRTEAVTSAMLGAFRENLQTREEFLSLIGRRPI